MTELEKHAEITKNLLELGEKPSPMNCEGLRREFDGKSLEFYEHTELDAITFRFLRGEKETCRICLSKRAALHLLIMLAGSFGVTINGLDNAINKIAR